MLVHKDSKAILAARTISDSSRGIVMCAPNFTWVEGPTLVLYPPSGGSFVSSSEGKRQHREKKPSSSAPPKNKKKSAQKLITAFTRLRRTHTLFFLFSPLFSSSPCRVLYIVVGSFVVGRPLSLTSTPPRNTHATRTPVARPPP